jgi:hypothetical protein
MKFIYLLFVDKCLYPINYSNSSNTIIIKLDKTNFTLNFFYDIKKKRFIPIQDEKIIDENNCFRYDSYDNRINPIGETKCIFLNEFLNEIIDKKKFNNKTNITLIKEFLASTTEEDLFTIFNNFVPESLIFNDYRYCKLLLKIIELCNEKSKIKNIINISPIVKYRLLLNNNNILIKFINKQDTDKIIKILNNNEMIIYNFLDFDNNYITEFLNKISLVKLTTIINNLDVNILIYCINNYCEKIICFLENLKLNELLVFLDVLDSKIHIILNNKLINIKKLTFIIQHIVKIFYNQKHSINDQIEYHYLDKFTNNLIFFYENVNKINSNNLSENFKILLCEFLINFLINYLFKKYDILNIFNNFK